MQQSVLTTDSAWNAADDLWRSCNYLITILSLRRAGEPFDVLQQHAQKLSDAQRAGRTTLSAADEDTLLNIQLDLSIALDARALTSTNKQQQQNSLEPSKPLGAAAGTAAHACQPDVPSSGYLHTPEPPFRYFAAPCPQRFGNPMAQPNLGPRFPNAASIEPHAPLGHSAQPTLFHGTATNQFDSNSYGHGGGFGTASNSEPHNHDDAMSSDFDDDALFDACDAAVAKYTSGNRAAEASTGEASAGGYSDFAHNPQQQPQGEEGWHNGDGMESEQTHTGACCSIPNRKMCQICAVKLQM